MRKVKLYASVALATLLAACSNDDFISNQSAQTDEARPTAKVALTFDENGPSTRLAWEKPADEGWQWVFADGDKIGALLMDDWNMTGQNPSDFTFTDYAHTNYPFIRKTENGVTTWNTPEDAAVQMGNYFFYFPYDKTFTGRGQVGWSVNPEQINYDRETGEHDYWQAVEDNQKWLGYAFIPPTTEGVNRVNFDFVPVFATPAFDITNLAMPLLIEKMVIREGSNSSNTSIDVNGKSSLLATSMMLAPYTGSFGDVNAQWESKDFDWHTSKMWLHAQRYTNNEFTYPQGPDGVSMQIKPSTDVWGLNGEVTDREATYQYTVDFGDKYLVEQGDHIQAMLVMPGGVYAKASGEVFEALIYVKNPKNNDRYVVRIGLGRPQTVGETNVSGWDDIASASADNFLKPGITTMFQAQFDAGALQSYAITDFKVTTSEELQWLLEEAAETVPTKLVVNTIGNKVAMTEDVYSLLKSLPNYRLYINGTITLPEGCAADGINLLNYDNTDVKTDLIIASEQVAAKDINNCTITITETGALDSKTNDVKVNATGIVNNGNVLAGNVVVGNDNIKNYKTFEADVVNATVYNCENGELTIHESVTTIFNYGTANTAGQLWNMTNEGNWFVRGDLLIHNSAKNNGVMTVADGVTVTDNKNDRLSLVNEDGAVINNQGTINRVYYNDGAIYNGSEADTDAELTIAQNRSAGIVYNYGKITDLISNGGNIYMQAGTAQVKFRDTDNGDGNIENTLHGDIENIGNQNIIYTAAHQDFATVISEMKTYGKYTELVIAGEYTLDGDDDISQTTTSTTVEKITVAANAIVDIDYNEDVQLGGANISLTNYGLITVNHGAILRVGTVTNNGSIKKNNNAQILDASGSDATGSISNIELFD